MWMMTKYGFYSVVEHRDDPQTVLIRARARKDLEELCEVADSLSRQYGSRVATGFTPDRILLDDTADYRFRLIVPRQAWMEVTLHLCEGVDYANFKNAVKERDPDRADVYMRVWSALYSIQTATKRLSDSMLDRMGVTRPGQTKLPDLVPADDEFDEGEWRRFAEDRGIDLDATPLHDPDFRDELREDGEFWKFEDEEVMERVWRESGGQD